MYKEPAIHPGLASVLGQARHAGNPKENGEGKRTRDEQCKPDFTFGIVANFHPDIDSERFSQRIRAILGVVPYISHPFLIIEGKSNRGSTADAENQALRGGSTLVRARRLLNGFAGGWKTTPGPIISLSCSR